MMKFSDVDMPEMSGIALFHALKQQDDSVKVVLLTGHLMEDQFGNQLAELKTMELQNWIMKPPSLEDLSQVIAQALQS
jgi:CheY-like chemotaxis protein